MLIWIKPVSNQEVLGKTRTLRKLVFPIRKRDMGHIIKKEELENLTNMAY